MDLSNKVAIVTGANHGIGAATAIAFANEGAKVLINYYRFAAEAYGDISEEEVAKATTPGRAYYCKMQTQTADHVVKAIEELGGKCLSVEADLSEPANIVMLFDEAERALGPVDIVVNNAAYAKCDTFLPENELKKNSLFVG